MSKGKKVMRILIHMGDPYSDDTPNGKRMRSFVEALREKGHDVGVLAPVDNSIKCSELIAYKSIPLKSKSTWNRLQNQISSGMNSVKASKGFGKADIVITSSPPALLSIFGWRIARKKHAKLVYDVRDIWPDVAWEMGSFSRKSFKSKVFVWNRDFMLKHSDLVLAVSRKKVQKLQGYCHSTDIVYIPNGLDERFLLNEERNNIVEKYELKKHFTCVYYGNIGLAQGLEQILTIAEKAQNEQFNVRFLLFGDGVVKEKLEEKVRLNGLNNVFFPGRIPNASIYSVLSNAGMSFISLVNEKLKDSVPTKLFESIGVGCPVLLAAVGESAEILGESKMGLAVRPNDEEKLWEAFKELYFHRETYTENKMYASQIILTKYSRQNAARVLEQELVGRFGNKD